MSTFDNNKAYGNEKREVVKIKQRLLKERNCDCNAMNHTQTIHENRKKCETLGHHNLKTKIKHRGRDSETFDFCIACDYVEWDKLYGLSFKGYLHSE